ncbi:hypothetical protein CHGG_08148 [Chaetomium globosum CBS 148.51]|uniref:Uncharacterized protein n=1 Tax=Chaetomium globosum (strain ATCC 6205 / CBS 148.51 / DSM 1962 / NBRC 6347 / NRRL 1970) TaxID=306901 RepID=Q2GV56_CHAGB|nr:uncharacterized protein CHGG_08148 [Chaetomium globosum CBS 148.51]EAQ86895.1 hypothetical protein CHGG_08148 [Chaetomium globosum CBS 148.51]
MACVKVLVEFGADSDIRTSNGTTALQLCFEMGDGTEEIVHFLLGRGADPNAQVGMSRTMLHMAAAMGLVRVVPLLLSAGVDATRCDSFGQTPWDNATRYGHGEIADALAEAGGRPIISQHSLLDTYQEGYPETLEDYEHHSPAGSMEQPPYSSVMLTPGTQGGEKLLGRMKKHWSRLKKKLRYCTVRGTRGSEWDEKKKVIIGSSL